MKFARRVFLIAGIYGLIVLVPLLFTEVKIGNDYPPAITHPEYYYGFLSLGVAWQVLFIFLSTNPVRYRPMMIPSMLEKFGFVIAAFLLFQQHRITVPVLIGSGLDLVLGVLFFIAFLKTPARQLNSLWSNR